MSRLAKRPVVIPSGAEITLSASEVRVKGPKGTLVRPTNRLVTLEMVDGGLQVTKNGESIEARATLGTYASHIKNMLEGVTQGFTKKLLIEGVGFKWEVAGNTVNLGLGFSHPVKVEIPAGLTVVADKTSLTITGFDKEVVGQFAANIRALKEPEPYKGKGIRYEKEVVRRKQGKKAA